MTANNPYVCPICGQIVDHDDHGRMEDHFPPSEFSPQLGRTLCLGSGKTSEEAEHLEKGALDPPRR